MWLGSTDKQPVAGMWLEFSESTARLAAYPPCVRLTGSGANTQRRPAGPAAAAEAEAIAAASSVVDSLTLRRCNAVGDPSVAKPLTYSWTSSVSEASCFVLCWS